VMAYLPAAVIPRARRYVDNSTMRAVDLTLARAILQESHMPTGALDVFFDRHLDPALVAQSDLREHLEEVDQIDLHGWLTRVMLAEYKAMGDRLYPGACDDHCLHDARAFRNWLGKLATQPPIRPGEQPKNSLLYRGPFLSADIVFVAMKGRIEDYGLDTYLKRTKQMIYGQKADVVYLMARDDNIPYVKQLRDSLKTDGLISEIATFEFRLRPDFAARKRLNRERAICVMLRRKRVHREALPADLSEIDLVNTQLGEVEVYEPGAEESTLIPAAEQDAETVGVGADSDATTQGLTGRSD
jgi:hypothetical protein